MILVCFLLWVSFCIWNCCMVFLIYLWMFEIFCFFCCLMCVWCVNVWDVWLLFGDDFLLCVEFLLMLCVLMVWMCVRLLCVWCEWFVVFFCVFGVLMFVGWCVWCDDVIVLWCVDVFVLVGEVRRDAREGEGVCEFSVFVICMLWLSVIICMMWVDGICCCWLNCMGICFWVLDRWVSFCSRGSGLIGRWWTGWSRRRGLWFYFWCVCCLWMCVCGRWVFCWVWCFIDWMSLSFRWSFVLWRGVRRAIRVDRWCTRWVRGVKWIMMDGYWWKFYVGLMYLGKILYEVWWWIF